MYFFSPPLIIRACMHLSWKERIHASRRGHIHCLEKPWTPARITGFVLAVLSHRVRTMTLLQHLLYPGMRDMLPLLRLFASIGDASHCARPPSSARDHVESPREVSSGAVAGCSGDWNIHIFGLSGDCTGNWNTHTFGFPSRFCPNLGCEGKGAGLIGVHCVQEPGRYVRGLYQV